MAGQADPIDRGRETLLRALREGDVRFVVIGGAALQSHGQRYETEDIDVTPDRAEQNLARLADVLNRLECSLEVDPAHPEKAVSLPPDYFTASVLAQATVWNLRTAHGKLDLTLAPSGFPEGYRPRRERRPLRTTCCEPTRATRSCTPHVPRSPIRRLGDATAHALSHTTSASRRSRRKSRRLSRATAVRSVRSSAPKPKIPAPLRETNSNGRLTKRNSYSGGLSSSVCGGSRRGSRRGGSSGIA